MKTKKVSRDFFVEEIVPTIALKDGEDYKKTILDHLKAKMIEVVDQDGNPIDLEGVLTVVTAQQAEADEDEMEQASADAAKAEDEEDEEEKTKRLIDSAVKAAIEATKKAAKKPARISVPAPGRVEVKDSTKFQFKGRRGQLKNFRGEVDGKSADQRAYEFGMWSLATIAQSCPGRFGNSFENAKKYVNDYITKVHATNSNPDGGYLVPEQFETDMIDLRESYGVVRRIFKNRPMSSDTRTDPRRKSGLTAYFVGETAAGTESSKGWDQVRLTAKDLMVISRYTAQLNEDAVVNIGDDLAGEIAYAFANKEDDCGLNGDGTSTYGGIQGVRTKIAAATASIFTQASGNTWSAITLGDFNNVLGKLPAYADTANARWVVHKAFYHGVMQRLELAAGGVPAQEIIDGKAVYRFLGYPVEIAQVMPAATATSHIPCLFGDFTLGASFGDRKGVSIMFSEHATVGGESVYERNEIAVRGTERFDINVHDVGDTSNAGPIVALKTGA